MKFDLLLWVINVLNFKFEWTALSSKHWGNHFSTIKNETNHHPLFLSSSSLRILSSPQPSRTRSITSRPTGIAGSHFQCLLGNSQLLYGKDIHPLGPTSSLHTWAPGLHWSMASHLPWLLALCPVFLSFLKFCFNTLTGERNTHLTPSGFQSCLSLTCLLTSIIYTSQSGSSLNTTIPAAPHHPGTSQHPRIFTTKVLPIIMLVCLDSVLSGSSLSRVAKWNWVSLAYPRVCNSVWL